MTSFYSNEMESGEEARESYKRLKYPLIGTEIISIGEKVTIPVNDYPSYNFLGKLIGPKGRTLKEIAGSTKTKISILGQGSTRDKVREEELVKSGEEEHQHFKEPLHVLIQVKAPRIEAHSRMAGALREINKYMVPEVQQPVMDIHNESSVDRNVAGGPILRYGIPPPGAIVIGQPSMSGDRHQGPGSREERPNHRPANQPQSRSPPSDFHSYGANENESYRGFEESREVNNYGFSEESGYRTGDKRATVSNDNFSKKYREDPFGETSRSAREPDSYYSPQYAASSQYSNHQQQHTATSQPTPQQYSAPRPYSSNYSSIREESY